jgi:hypothetical protein
MRRAGIFLLMLAVLSLAGCEPAATSLRMLVSTEEPAPSVAAAIQPLLAEVGLRVAVEPDDEPASIFEAVATGAVDLAVVEEPARAIAGVMTVVPLFPSVLHVLVRGESAGAGFESLIGGRSVYAGPVGGSAHRLLQRLAADAGIAEERFELLDNPWEREPDVFFVFGGLLSADSLRQLSDYRLYSFGDVDELGRGALAEGIVLRHPNLRTFILPRGTYPGLSEDPVLTLAIPSLLVARNGLDEGITYAVAEQLYAHAQDIAAVYPLTTRVLNADMDTSRLTLPLHGGSRRFLERDRPGFIERYAEVFALAATLLIALVSGAFALVRRRRQRKKDRVDVYYGRILALRQEAESAPPEALASIGERVGSLQSEVFQLVIDERIAADESLSVFLSLSNQVLSEIERRRSRSDRQAV